MIEQTVGTLSGGERARLSLLKLILERHNVLLLDEPTNHLDTDTREALEEALVGYSGTLIVVSHDRYFLNRICNRVVAFEGRVGGGGGLRQFLGNYDDYRYRIQQERAGTDRSRASEPTPPPPSPPAAAPVAARPATKRDLSKNELRKVRRDIQDLEEEIALLESEVELAGEAMSSGRLDGEAMAREARRVQERQTALEAKIKRWEELSALMEREG